MRTVTETTVFSKFDKVAEDQINRVLGLPQSQGPNAGRVEHHACVVGQQDKFPSGGGVATFGIARPNLTDLEHRITDERIDE